MRNKTHYVRNKLVLGNRDREDKNYCIILFTCVSLHHTRVLFIGHKQGTKIIKVHSLVGVIGKGRARMNIH
jgi:hypothetical protein